MRHDAMLECRSDLVCHRMSGKPDPHVAVVGEFWNQMAKNILPANDRTLSTSTSAEPFFDETLRGASPIAESLPRPLFVTVLAMTNEHRATRLADSIRHSPQGIRVFGHEPYECSRLTACVPVSS